MSIVNTVVAYVLIFVQPLITLIALAKARHKRKRIGSVAFNDLWNPQPSRASQLWRKYGFGFTVFSMFFTLTSIISFVIYLIYHLL